MKEDLSDWVPASELVEQAMDDLGIDKPKEELVDADIKSIMHYIGEWASDTDYTNPYYPRIGLLGVGLMLTVTLLVFPEYYERYELAQFN